VWLRDTPMAMFTPDPANPSGEPPVYFIRSDHLNTPRVVVDRENRVRWRWLAEPFGTSAPETDPSGLGGFTQNLRFPGAVCGPGERAVLQLPPVLRGCRWGLYAE
jgi:uncharacterized protein RhaS with RHS repeats